MEEFKAVFGGTIHDVLKNCKEKAIQDDCTYYFDFNGIECRVNKKTNLDHVARDYFNAHFMKWRVVGPAPDKVYSEQLQNEIEKAEEKAKRKIEKEQEEYRLKCEKEKREFEFEVEGVDFAIVDQKRFSDWKSKNTDPYGNVCFEYAELWAKRLQKELDSGANIDLIKDEFEYQPNYLGITGFQHGAAKSILRECWKYGKHL